MLRKIEILTLFASLTMGAAFAQTRYWCGSAKPLPLEYSRSAPFRLDDLKFTSADVSSFGAVKLSASAIRDFIFIIELVDGDGQHVISIPISSRGPKNGHEFDAIIPTWYPGSGPMEAWHWDSSPRPMNGSEEVQFWSPVVPSNCPASGRLVGAQVSYRDGKRYRYRESELTVDPTLIKVPITSSQKWFDLVPLEFTGRIHIDTFGHPKVTELKSASGGETSWLRDQISSWTFSPELANGQRTAADIGFYLVVGTEAFDLSTVERLRSEPGISSVLVFRVVPPSPGGKWELQLANWPVF